MSDVTITVRGEHEARVPPEQGVAHIAVQCEGARRADVVERVGMLAAPLRDELAERLTRGYVAEWSSKSVAVWSERPWNSEGRQLALVHHASLELSAAFTDFEALSSWISAAAEREGVQVNGVTWRLTPATRKAVEASAAAEAVGAAVARASAYAAALGRASVTPLEVADIGLLPRTGADSAPAPEMLRGAMMSADSGAPGPAVEMQPEPILVTARVEARFTAR